MTPITHSGLIQRWLIYIRSSLWFVPGLMLLLAISLAMALIEIDQRYDEQLRRWWPHVFQMEAEGARSMLSAIAGSMATVTGVAFSITIVALALASSQYTSRVLRNFMRDRANQFVLGVFIGVYIYCLLVLRTISGGEDAFVPSLAVLGSLLLAVVAVGLFIFFIHHISSSIQASEIAASITLETLEVINRHFPETGADDTLCPLTDSAQSGPWQIVPSLTMGYIQSVDPNALYDLACQRNTQLRMECKIGDFVAPGQALLAIRMDQAPDETLVSGLNRLYAIASYRTIEQDVGFGVRQLVDVALKALSPGINDTTTATTCLDHLTVILSLCAQRCLETPFRYEGNALRVVVNSPTFGDLSYLAFSQILENAEGNTVVLAHVLQSIRKIAASATSKPRLATLRIWVEVVDEIATRSASSTQARQRMDKEIAEARTALTTRDKELSMNAG